MTAFTRRTLGGLATAAMLPTVASAQAPWPQRPLRWIVPYAAGGGSDFLARTLAAAVGNAIGQSIAVENRGGGATIPATEMAARSAPDGYTLLSADLTALVITPAMARRLPYDPIRDFRPVAPIARFPYVILVHPDVPARTAAELVALAKARPNTLNFAHAGTGNRTARIEIPSNDNETSPFILRLSGSATPLPIESWRISLFQNGLNSGNSSNLSDPDRDGVANLLEYGFGTNPKAADFFPPVPNDIISAGSKRHLRLYIDRRRDDLNYIVESSTDLNIWTPVKTYEGIGTESAFFEDASHDLNAPSQPRRFLRVRVTER
jgi:hypothetical protein